MALRILGLLEEHRWLCFRLMLVRHALRFVLFCALGMPSYGLTVEEAQHLLSRTGFGASPAEISRLAPMTREQAVDDLLHNVVTAPDTPAPEWIGGPIDVDQKNMTPDERMAYQKKIQAQRLELKAWWYREMITTPTPFTEHMTLFWHNHFTSAFEKVGSPVLMYRQNLLLRRCALGNFTPFLIEIAKDPAMMRYLDNQNNHKGHPNENFSRELLELYTLGIGHYEETDIKEAARAFTGWGIDKDGMFVFRKNQHDDGEKTFLGHTSKFQGDNIIYILLEDPRLSQFITEKLWKEFISDSPDPKEVRRLATIFRTGHYELKPLMRALLLTPAFWDPGDYGTLTKSPVEFMVGSVRTFNIPVGDTMPLVMAGRTMGQDIMDPPNVKGWPGGNWWISTNTWLLRRQFMDRLLRGKEMEYLPKDTTMTMAQGPLKETLQGLDLNQWMGQAGFHDQDDMKQIAAILLPIPPQPDTLSAKADIPHQIQSLVYDPGYQLK